MIKKIFICFCFCFCLFLIPFNVNASQIEMPELPEFDGYDMKSYILYKGNKGIIYFEYMTAKSIDNVEFTSDDNEQSLTYTFKYNGTNTSVKHFKYIYENGTWVKTESNDVVLSSDGNRSVSIKAWKIDGHEIYQNVGHIKPSDEDIPSLNWEGDGIRIYSPPDGSSIKGYKSKDTVNLKMYDVVIYGKYKSKNGFFDTVDGIKTSIMRSVSVNFANTERKVGEGVGVKNFTWIIEPKDGQEARFKIVLYVPMWKATTGDLTVKATVKMYDGDKVTFSDTNKSITLLSDNTDENIDKDSPDVEGAIGGSWDDSSGVMDDNFINGSSAPSKPEGLNPIDWIVWLIDYIVYFITSLIKSLTTIVNTVLKAFADLTNEFTMAIGKFTQIFGMLPSPLPQLIVLSLSVLCMTTIIRLIRG